MRITLLGYGKMGRAIEAAATGKGHAITYRIDKENAAALATLGKADTDVVIEFTHPDAVLGNLRVLLAKGIPTVVGTTGWLAHVKEIEALAKAGNVPVVYGANYSIGVNIFMAVNRKLAALMATRPEYDVFIEERHHRHKADAPSGTALRLAADVVAALPHKQRIVTTDAYTHQAPSPTDLTVGVVRAGEIPGTHRVAYTSPTDVLEICHTAHNRDGFAHGAVLAAEWLLREGKPGLTDFATLFA
jgi:4-hydroxy-tetrahydrodipicolinate reductase